MDDENGNDIEIRELPPFYREYELRQVEGEDDRLYEMTFSSEEPYERWYGIEILDHGRDSVRLDRLRSAGVLLFNHDRDRPAGMLEDVELKGRKASTKARLFAEGDPDADYVQRKLQGGLRSVSVGYRVYEMVLEKSASDGPDVYRITDWEPFEVSAVSIPADVTVGVGRSEDEEQPTNPVRIRGETEMLRQTTFFSRALPVQEKNDGLGAGDPGGNPAPAGQRSGTPATPDPKQITAAQSAGADAERHRQAEIRKLGARFPNVESVTKLQQKAIDDGMSVDDFARQALEELGHRTFEPKPLISTDIPGVGQREKKRFSLARLVRCLAAAAPGFVDARTAKAWREGGQFELEVCGAYRDVIKRDPREEASVTIPHDLLYGGVRIMPGEDGQHRVLTVGTEGADIVDTDMRVEDFIEALRNQARVVQAGARVIPGLVGDVLVPKQTGVGAITWVAESGAAADTTQTLGQMSLTPHTMAARSDISRRLLLQSAIVIDSFVSTDLRNGMTVELDRVAIEGNPDVTATADEPRGVIYQSGIGSVALGTHGAAPTRANLVDLVTEVARDNALMGIPSFLMNSLTIGFFQKLLLDAGSGRFVMEDRSSAIGFPVHESNNVPADLAKGVGTNLSAIPFGDWTQLVIGLWSGQDILVDPYTQGTSGALRLIAFQDVDCNVRQAVSFGAILDANVS